MSCCLWLYDEYLHFLNLIYDDFSSSVAFMPHLETCFSEVLKLIDYPAANVRKAAITSSGQLCCSLYKALQDTNSQETQGRSCQLTNQSWWFQDQLGFGRLVLKPLFTRTLTLSFLPQGVHGLADKSTGLRLWCFYSAECGFESRSWHLCS